MDDLLIECGRCFVAVPARVLHDDNGIGSQGFVL